MATSAPRSSPRVAHEVRIIGGQWKRTKLPVADRPGLRPTPDRVRETLFNWLGHPNRGKTQLFNAIEAIGKTFKVTAMKGTIITWIKATFI